MYVCMYVWLYVCMIVCMDGCMDGCMYGCMYIRIYIYIYYVCDGEIVRVYNVIFVQRRPRPQQPRGCQTFLSASLRTHAPLQATVEWILHLQGLFGACVRQRIACTAQWIVTRTDLVCAWGPRWKESSPVIKRWATLLFIRLSLCPYS